MFNNQVILCEEFPHPLFTTNHFRKHRALVWYPGQECLYTLYASLNSNSNFTQLESLLY